MHQDNSTSILIASFVDITINLLWSLIEYWLGMKKGIYGVQNTEQPLFKIQTNPSCQESVKIGGGPLVAFFRY